MTPRWPLRGTSSSTMTVRPCTRSAVSRSADDRVSTIVSTAKPNTGTHGSAQRSGYWRAVVSRERSPSARVGPRPLCVWARRRAGRLRAQESHEPAGAPTGRGRSPRVKNVRGAATSTPVKSSRERASCSCVGSAAPRARSRRAATRERARRTRPTATSPMRGVRGPAPAACRCRTDVRAAPPRARRRHAQQSALVGASDPQRSVADRELTGPAAHVERAAHDPARTGVDTPRRPGPEGSSPVIETVQTASRVTAIAAGCATRAKVAGSASVGVGGVTVWPK